MAPVMRGSGMAIMSPDCTTITTPAITTAPILAIVKMSAKPEALCCRAGKIGSTSMKLLLPERATPTAR
jgi:hypothetical protein